MRGAAQGDPVPAVRCAALEALLWTQVGCRARDQQHPPKPVGGRLAGVVAQGGSLHPVVPPSGLGAFVAKSRWPKDLLQALFGRIYQVLRAIPAAAPQLLQLAGAIASSAAGALEVGALRPRTPSCRGRLPLTWTAPQADQLLELWSAAMKLPDGKAAAMSAALSLLSSPPPAAPSSAAGELASPGRAVPAPPARPRDAARPVQARQPPCASEQPLTRLAGWSCFATRPGGWARTPTWPAMSLQGAPRRRTSATRTRLLKQQLHRWRLLPCR